MNYDNNRYITGALRRRWRVCCVLLGLTFVMQLASVFTSPAEVPLHWGG